MAIARHHQLHSQLQSNNQMITKEVIKMLELMDKSPRVRKFIWGVLFTVLFYITLVYLPDVINAIANYKAMIK